MQITIFTIGMTVLWSSVLIVLFYFLRKRSVLLEVCSVSGVILLYLFCLVRLAVPVEFPWSRMIYGGAWYNRYNEFMYMSLFGSGFCVWQLLLIVWGGGTVVFLLRFCGKYRSLLQSYDRLIKEKDEEVTQILAEIVREGKRMPEVVRAEAVRVPCCFGVLKQRILLPKKNYTGEELYYILLHEYSHLKHNDTLIKVLTNILCALYWWNPLVYLLQRDLDQSIEIRCDRMVVHGMEKEARMAYLQILLAEYKEYFEEKGSDKESHILSPLFEAHTNPMIERFMQLKGKSRGSELRGQLVAFGITLALLTLSYSFVFQSRYECPLEEIETGEQIHQLETDQMIILHCKDGSYLIRTEYGDIPATAEEIRVFIDEGVLIIEEGELYEP